MPPARLGGRRRAVTVDGVVGMLVCRGGCWGWATIWRCWILEALRGYGGSRERLLALVATLDAGLADGARLRRVNRVFRGG